MLFESQAAIGSRQNRARAWLREFAAKQTLMDEQCKALAVIALTYRTSDWLAENDPQALKQVQLALNGKSWEDF